MQPETLMVIDGNSLAHRAFHAIPLLSTSKGVFTNAVYGFYTMLSRILNEKKPRYVAVCFDKGKITFRHGQYGEYKATRKATPDELRPQFPLLKELLSAMAITVIEKENFEADDLIGALVTCAGVEKINSIIVTGDRDALQLVSPKVKVLLTKKGISELEEYDEARVKERFGVTPGQLIDFKGLVGDPSDNIPGVPGIGEKTAAKLIQEHSSLDRLLEVRQSLPARLRDKLEQFSHQALLSRSLATIDTGAPLGVEARDCLWEGPDSTRLLSLFSTLEFKSLMKNIAPPQETHRVDYTVIKGQPEIEKALGAALNSPILCLEMAGDRELGIDSISIGAGGATFLAQISGSGEKERREVLKLLQKICGSKEIQKVCHDAKAAIWMLSRHGIALKGLIFDTMLAAYLLNPGTPNQNLPDLALEYLNIALPAPGQEDYLPVRAAAVLKLYPLLGEKIKEYGMKELYHQVELPLVPVLARMEMAGVMLDNELLNEMSTEMTQKLLGLTRNIHDLAGEPFNINSTKQLGQILFEKLGLPALKRTKTGYSTDAGVLEELAGSHQIVAQLLEYRQLMKLKSTYVDGLINLTGEGSLVHTTLHQNVTATGRLSSAEPNLQNIPIRMEEGRKIRKAFIPRDRGSLIVAADYSQIELRILAHMSGDPLLVDAFLHSQDIHTRTASEVFGVPMDQVTREMRDRAKAVNFGIVYGISDFGLARDLKIPRPEAQKYIEGYFARYSGVKAYINKTVALAKDQGYVTTILNRRRYLPDLLSSNKMVRNFGERTAMNTPIQGSAADIIKLAMIRVQEELFKSRLKTVMILQVHDELIFDTPSSELEEIKELVRGCMENAVPLSVPLTVDIKVGPNWYEVKKI